MRRIPSILVAFLISLAAFVPLLMYGQYRARQELGAGLFLPSSGERSSVVQPPPDMLERLGDETNLGTSINAAPGDVPMESAVADPDQSQAMLQRDPMGQGRPHHGESVAQALGDAGGGARSANALAAQEAALADPAPRGPKLPPIHMHSPAATPASPSQSTDPAANKQVQVASEVNPLALGPLHIPPPGGDRTAATPAPPQQSPPPTPPQAAAQASGSGQGSSGGDAGSNSNAGRPEPTGDTDSFPVTQVVAKFQAGKIETRYGRKSKTPFSRDDVSLASWADLQTLDHAIVILRLDIDVTGHVTKVALEQSSGSDNLDQDCERRAGTWWFEPWKDARTGKAIPQQIEFGIRFF